MVGVLTDTTASIPQPLVNELDIEVVSYRIHKGLDTLLDMVEVQPDPFAKFLETTDMLPTTSNPSIGDYLAGLKRLAERTCDIVALTMTSKGSGAYQSCRAAVEILRERMPSVQAEVVDTLKVAMSQGWAVIEAARSALAGANLTGVVNRAIDVAHRSTMVMTADTLRYLYMGGRIGQAQHLVGSLLSIKPLIGVEEGAIVALGAARTRAKAYARMVEIACQQVGAGARVKAAFTHVAALDQVERLRALTLSQLNCIEELTTQLSPALAVHAGPGTVGMSLFASGAA